MRGVAREDLIEALPCVFLVDYIVLNFGRRHRLAEISDLPDAVFKEKEGEAIARILNDGAIVFDLRPEALGLVDDGEEAYERRIEALIEGLAEDLLVEAVAIVVGDEAQKEIVALILDRAGEGAEGELGRRLRIGIEYVAVESPLAIFKDEARDASI